MNKVKVTLISRKGSSALVEYVDGVVKRVYIPSDELGDLHIELDYLSQGIPYGYPWEEMTVQFDSDKFADELHKAGIWTVEDALKNPQGLWSGLRATLADNINNILTAALQEKKRSKNHGTKH